MDAEDFLDEDEMARLGVPGAAAPMYGDGLRFKPACDACGTPLTWIGPAFICAAECTCCPDCAEAQGMVCPQCSTPLRARPRRARPLGR